MTEGVAWHKEPDTQEPDTLDPKTVGQSGGGGEWQNSSQSLWKKKKADSQVSPLASGASAETTQKYRDEKF